MEGTIHRVLILMGVAGLLFFSRLDLPLLEPQEARYAEIPRQMLATGSWLTPVLHGQPYLDKPPLLYWGVLGCYGLLGVHDWAARLVPGLSCFFTVLIVHFWGRRVAGERAGFAGALLLCLSARYVYLGRMLGFDTLLALWTTAALASAHLWIVEGNRRWWVLASLACSLGILTKGPVALVLVLIPLALWRILARDGRRPSLLGLFLLPALAGLMAAPWFLRMACEHPEFLIDFFWRHHVVRFAEPFDHAEPFWFHLPGVVLGMLPWTLLLPHLLRELWARRVSESVLFCAVAAGWGLLFFSLSGCKRAVYIVPVLPVLALALGCHLEANREQLSRLARPATLLVLFLGAVTAVAASISGLLSWPAGLCFALVGFVVMGWLGRGSITWRDCTLVTCAVLLLALWGVMPAYSDRFALRSSVLAQREEASASGVVCYPRSWDSVSFYLGRQDCKIYSGDQREQLLGELSRSPRTLVVLKAGRTAEDLVSRFPETLSFELAQQKGFVLLGWVKHQKRHARED